MPWSHTDDKLLNVFFMSMFVYSMKALLWNLLPHNMTSRIIFISNHVKVWFSPGMVVYTIYVVVVASPTLYRCVYINQLVICVLLRWIFSKLSHHHVTGFAIASVISDGITVFFKSRALWNNVVYCFDRMLNRAPISSPYGPCSTKLWQLFNTTALISLYIWYVISGENEF